MKFFEMSDKITTVDTILSMAFVKVVPLWFVRVCDRLGLIRFFSPFFAANKLGTLDQVVKVKFSLAQVVL